MSTKLRRPFILISARLSPGLVMIISARQLPGLVLIAGLIGSVVAVTSVAQASHSEGPEKETLRLSKMLKPIPDAQWTEIAGSHISERYGIVEGDNLYNVSKRLFGDPRYWPKIWALNNDTILNPHLILPGNQIAFVPGTGTSLPAVAVVQGNGNQTATDAKSAFPGLQEKKARSQEWRELPTQAWEAEQVAAELASKKDIQVMGSLDRISAAALSRELPAFASTKQVTALGQVLSAPGENSYFKVDDKVLVSANGDGIQEGKTYELIGAPQTLRKSELEYPEKLWTDEPPAVGYGYFILGQIQINSRQGDNWSGTIVQARSFIPRGTLLVSRHNRISPMDPVMGPSPMEGMFFINPEESSFVEGQHGFGFVNLGSEDGIQAGMIFQSFQNKDPSTLRPLERKEFFHIADLQVIQVSEHVCTVRIVSGSSEVEKKTMVRLMTDPSKAPKESNTANSDLIQDEEAPPPPSTEPPPAEVGSDLPPVEPAPDEPAPEASDSAAAAPAETPADADLPPPPPAEAEAPPAEATPAPAEAAVPPPVEVPPIAPTAEAANQAPLPAPVSPKNELDEITGDENLGKDDANELKQLENYKGAPPAEVSTSTTPPETAPQTIPDSSSPVTPGATPPPPPSGSKPSGGTELPPSEPQVVD